MTAQRRKAVAPSSAFEAAVAAAATPKAALSAFAKAAARVDYEPHDDARVTWRRAAYRAVLSRARAVALVGVLPAAVNRETLQTSAGNAWFRSETGLGDRSVTYGLSDLSDAGLVDIKLSGPRRTITLLVPEKPARGMRA